MEAVVAAGVGRGGEIFLGTEKSNSVQEDAKLRRELMYAYQVGVLIG